MQQQEQRRQHDEQHARHWWAAVLFSKHSQIHITVTLKIDPPSDSQRTQQPPADAHRRRRTLGALVLIGLVTVLVASAAWMGVHRWWLKGKSGECPRSHRHTGIHQSINCALHRRAYICPRAFCTT
ncbi:unnamed protein product [Sphagnum balticum]